PQVSPSCIANCGDRSCCSLRHRRKSKFQKLENHAAQKTVSIFRFRRLSRRPAESLRSPKEMMPSINFYFLSFSFSMFYFPEAYAGSNFWFTVWQGVKVFNAVLTTDHAPKCVKNLLAVAKGF